METYAVYLWPRGSLASEIGSDTLFGATCWALRVLGLADIGAMLARFDPPRFAFSSPFPVCRVGRELLRFYPRPLWLDLAPAALNRLAEAGIRENGSQPPKTVRLDLAERAKALSQVGYVSEALFGQIVRGELDATGLLGKTQAQGKQPAEVERNGAVLLTRSERAQIGTSDALDGLMQRQAVQHNQVDRVAGATVEGMLFYSNELHFAAGTGLWCLVRASAADAERLIRPALRYMADTGLGADRTAGKGQFDIELGPAPALPDAGQAANGWLTLSRYLPGPGDWEPGARPLAYRLANLWAKREQRYSSYGIGESSPIYKRRIRVFEPGSVFPMTAAPDICGRLAAVVPDAGDGQTIYQSGLALGVRALVPGIGG